MFFFLDDFLKFPRKTVQRSISGSPNCLNYHERHDALMPLDVVLLPRNTKPLETLPFAPKRKPDGIVLGVTRNPFFRYKLAVTLQGVYIYVYIYIHGFVLDLKFHLHSGQLTWNLKIT